MSCLIDSGLARGCRDSAGGMYTFYVANYPTGTTTSTDYLTKDVDGIVTDFSGATTSIAGFYEFTPNKNSGSFTEEYQISLENGTRGYNQSVTGNFSKLEASKQDLVDTLATGTFVVIAKDKNGKFFLMGENDGAVLSEGSAGTGVALSDLNGYALTLNAMEGSPAAEIDSAAITVL